MAARRGAARAVLRARARRRSPDGVGREALHHRRARGPVRARPAGARPPRRPCVLVLPRQAPLARRPRLLLPALGLQPGRVVGVPVPRRRGLPGDRGLGVAKALARAARRAAVLRRRAPPGARLRRRLPVPLLVRRRSLPVPRQPGRHRPRQRARRDVVGAADGLAPHGGHGRVPPRAGGARRPHLAPEPALREQRDPLPRHSRAQPGLLAGAQQPRRHLPRAPRRRRGGEALLRVPAAEPGVRGGAQQLRLRPRPARPRRRGDRVLPARPRRSGPTTPTPTSTSATPSS